jgi:hypothetical protein
LLKLSLLPREEAEIMGVKTGRVFPSYPLLSREEADVQKSSLERIDTPRRRA